MRLRLLLGLALLSAACDSYRPPPRPTAPPQPAQPARPAPVQPQPAAQPAPPPDPMISLSSHASHTCARRRSGAVACWGNNSDGQIGDGSRTDQPRAVNVPGLSNISELAAGHAHTCARRGAQILCWGNNEDGQLGDGLGAKPGARATAPVTVKGLADAVELVTGDAHTCARRKAGTVTCWGLGDDGQLSIVKDRSAALIAVADLSQVAQVVAGANHTCARKTSGDVLCWGRNTEGQLGDDKSGSKIKPVAVVGLKDATHLVAGGNHTCALRRSGAPVCWGSNSHGQLGDGTSGTFAQRRPVAVQGLPGAIAELVAGQQHTCARTQDGKVMCWGRNNFGQLGDGSTTDRPKPTPVARLEQVTNLALGTAHSCALQTTGNVTCWGSDEHRALGPRRL
jgi:alpha-tubulin suppressor-like RCC1 family protein